MIALQLIIPAYRFPSGFEQQLASGLFIGWCFIFSNLAL